MTLEWDVPITPENAPILNYNLTYWLANESRADSVSVETPGNDTTFDLHLPLPGRSYKVVVSGRNVLGQGEETSPGVVMSVLGEVPPAPQGVSVEQEGAVATVSWQVRPLSFVLVVQCS